jgi:thioredoxin reductase
VDVVALNVVRRTAAYSWRLRLFEGSTLTARSVVIATGVTCRRLGVPAPAVRQEALASPVAGSASRREGRRKIIPAGAGWLAASSDQQIRCGRVTGGCRRPVLAPRAGGL